VISPSVQRLADWKTCVWLPSTAIFV